MFRIGLYLVKESWEGLEALDERRRLGLSDGVLLKTPSDMLRSAPVDESFARKYFNRTETTKYRNILVRLLSPGDVQLHQGSDVWLEFHKDITPERVIALWLLADDSK